MGRETVRKYPFEIEEYYSVGLNSLKRIYTQHPRFNGNARLIYELLLDYWNEEYGYAFPDQWELAIESGMSVSTVGRSIKALEDLRLIEKKRSPIGRNNNVYYINKPIDNITDFYKAFPEIEKEARERIAKIEAEKQSKMDTWDKDKREGKPHAMKRTLYLRPNDESRPKNRENGIEESDNLREVEGWL